MFDPPEFPSRWDAIRDPNFWWLVAGALACGLVGIGLMIYTDWWWDRFLT